MLTFFLHQNSWLRFCIHTFADALYACLNTMFNKSKSIMKIHFVRRKRKISSEIFHPVLLLIIKIDWLFANEKKKNHLYSQLKWCGRSSIHLYTIDIVIDIQSTIGFLSSAECEWTHKNGTQKQDKPSQAIEQCFRFCSSFSACFSNNFLCSKYFT